MIMATMVIHNICMQHRDDTVRYGVDKEVVEFMEKFQQQICNQLPHQQEAVHLPAPAPGGRGRAGRLGVGAAR